MTTTSWALPQDVTDLDLAFGGRAMELMPARDECEQALNAMPDRGRPWRKFQSDWFFGGLTKDTEFVPREGIDSRRALRHLTAIQRSWEPKHEHKEAGVAFLASLWFQAPPATVVAS